MSIADTRWQNGERDIGALNPSGPPQIDNLKMRLHLQVQKFGGNRNKLTIDLRQARVRLDTDNLWSNLYKADESEHARGAGIDVAGLLNDYGADVGRCAALLGDSSPTGNRLCAVFPGSAEQIPIVAFVATRVLPLLKYGVCAEFHCQVGCEQIQPTKASWI